MTKYNRISIEKTFVDRFGVTHVLEVSADDTGDGLLAHLHFLDFKLISREMFESICLLAAVGAR